MVYGLGADIYPSLVIAGYANTKPEYPYNHEGREFISKAGHAKPIMKIGGEILSPESTAGGYKASFLAGSLRTEDMQEINATLRQYRLSTAEDREIWISRMRKSIISSMTLAQNDNNRPNQNFNF
jgi:hypothetical protein